MQAHGPSDSLGCGNLETTAGGQHLLNGLCLHACRMLKKRSMRHLN